MFKKTISDLSVNDKRIYFIEAANNMDEAEKNKTIARELYLEVRDVDAIAAGKFAKEWVHWLAEYTKWATIHRKLYRILTRDI